MFLENGYLYVTNNIYRNPINTTMSTLYIIYILLEIGVILLFYIENFLFFNNE